MAGLLDAAELQRTTSDPMTGNICAVCCETLGQGKHRPAAGSCEHLHTCSLCYLRLRRLMGDMACPMCKTMQEHVYIFRNFADVRPFKTLNVWGNSAGPGVIYDDASCTFMPREFYTEVYQALQSPDCRLEGCGKKCGTLHALRDHLKNAHERFLCDVCMDHKKAFLGEQILYTKVDLAQHVDKGDPSHGFFGHPNCQFCRKRFYDTGHLYGHLVHSHYSCDLCEKAGIQHKYYRNYEHLQEHFRHSHYLCEDPRCLEQRFVVFADEIDYQGHVIAAHPEQNTSKKLALSFRTRGHRGVVRDAMEETDREVERAIMPMDGIPNSFQMTTEDFPDLSQQTAQTRSRMNGADYTTLSTAPGLQSTGTGRSRGRFSSEDFPALPGDRAGRSRPAGFRGAVAGGLGAFLHRDRDRWSYPEVDIGRGRGRQAPKKENGIAMAAGKFMETTEGGQGVQAPHGGQNLLENVKGLVGETAFASLREISRQLRMTEVTSEQYYDEVVRLMPEAQIRVKVMEELLQILPDEGLREEIRGLMRARELESNLTSIQDSSKSSQIEQRRQATDSEAQGQPFEARTQPQEAYPSLRAPSEESQPTGRRSSNKKSTKAQPVDAWSKAIASAAGGTATHQAVPRGQKARGLTIVKFGKDGGRQGAQHERGEEVGEKAPRSTALDGYSRSVSNQVSEQPQQLTGMARLSLDHDRNFPTLPTRGSDTDAPVDGQRLPNGLQLTDGNWGRDPQQQSAKKRKEKKRAQQAELQQLAFGHGYTGGR